MKDQDKNFENEPTPIAQAMHKRQEKVSAFSSHRNTDHSPPDWNDDKTEVLINNDSSLTSHPILLATDGSTHTLLHFPYLIGRDNDCDLQPNGRGISRRHAEISVQAGRFVIKDLGSANGVKVNGYNVSQVLLEDQDIISIGDCNFTFANAFDEKSEPQLNWGVEVPPLHVLRAEHQKPPRSKLWKLSGILFIILGIVFLGNFFLNTNNRTLTVPASIAEKKTPPSETPVSKTTEKPDEKPIATETNPQEAKVVTNTKTLETNNKTPKTSSAKQTNQLYPVQSKPKQTAHKSSTNIPNIPQQPKASNTADKKTTNNTQYTHAILSTAKKDYLSGFAEKAISELKRISADTTLPNSVADSAAELYVQFNNLHTLYEQGIFALAQGENSDAMHSWSEYLDQSKTFFPEQSSPYQKKALQSLAKAYETQARNAEQNNNFQTAYLNWQKLYQLNASKEAKTAIEALNTLAQDMYRNGLRQEYVNTKKAIEYWQKTKTIVPAENEYHQKAEAKLALHSRWN